MKHRADILAFSQGLADSREKAQALIMEGRIYRDEVMVQKASELFEEETLLVLRGEKQPFASRGAYKLEKAMAAFGADVRGLVCMDIGAAAGGFTDILLRAGAEHVYAVDVGYGQMDWKLRSDPRVTVMERTNARHLTREMLPKCPQFTVMDVSFISIKIILPVAAGIMGETGRFLTLVKPQFEAGRHQVGKNGVVRDASVHEKVLRDVRDFCSTFNWGVRAYTFSPIRGPKGNLEFLADIRFLAGDYVTDEDIRMLVEQAHREL